jgi:hypothetical protein
VLDRGYTSGVKQTNPAPETEVKKFIAILTAVILTACLLVKHKGDVNGIKNALGIK